MVVARFACVRVGCGSLNYEDGIVSTWDYLFIALKASEEVRLWVSGVESLEIRWGLVYKGVLGLVLGM